MDVLNYDNAVSAFNNLEAFQSEKQEQFKELVQQYKEGAEQVILPAIDLFRRGKEAYGKLTGEKPAAAEGEGVTIEGENAISGAVEGAEGAVRGLASETLGALTSRAEGALSGVTSQLGEFSSSIRGIGNQLSERMRTNAFERDPEAEIASGEENMGILDRVQSIFRGGVSEGENAVSSAVSGVRGSVTSAISEGTEAATSAVSGATEAATGAISSVASSVAEGVGTAVAEGIGAAALDAIPVVGEIGMLALGVYDFFKGQSVHAPPPQAFATPVLEKGV